MSTETTPPNYPNDTPPERVESLIADVADLQKQVLRRFTQSVLEEMRYHLWVAQQKIKVLEEENRRLRSAPK